MGKAIPFSEIDEYFDIEGPIKGCLVDTSFLIAISDEDHDFHDDVRFMYEKLSSYKVPIFINVTARAEFVDFHRRVLISEALMDMLAPSSKWKISSSVREVLRSQKGWIDNQARGGQDPYLTDVRIKKCKQVFLPKTQSGQIGWVELCREFLSGRLQTSWNEISTSLGLNYIEMRSGDSKSNFTKELEWGNLYKICESTAMGSNDAMILNLFDSSVFKFVITLDYDLAYGTILNTTDKIALVPDNVYRNHIKKLRF